MAPRHACDLCAEPLRVWWNLQAYPSKGYDIEGVSGERVRLCHSCCQLLFDGLRQKAGQLGLAFDSESADIPREREWPPPSERSARGRGATRG